MLTKEQKAAKKIEKQLDEQVALAYSRHGYGVQINVMDIGKLYKDCKAAVATGISMDDAMLAAIAKYRQN